MIGSLVKRLSILLVPSFLLIAAYLAVPHLGNLPTPWSELLPYLPYAMIGAALFLSLHFHRGRIFFILLVLALFYWSCGAYLRNGLATFREQMIFQSLSLLLPLNITLFCFMREKGVFSLGGRLRFIFLALQVMLVAWLIGHNFTGVEHFLSRPYFSSTLFDGLPLAQIPSFFVIVGSLLMFIRVMVRKSHLDSGLLGAMAAVVIICAMQGQPDMALAFISAAGLILALSLLQDTYNMAYRDDLTGLQARRALNEQLAGLGRQYVVAMVDVDHFKRFNDTFGHDVGDQVLKMVASKIDGVRGGWAGIPLWR